MSEPYILMKGIVKQTQKVVLHKEKHKHYIISFLVGENNYTAAINVYSYKQPHALRYYLFENYSVNLTKKVTRLEDGLYQNLGQGCDSLAIDYLRSGLFDMDFITILSSADAKDDSNKLEAILENWSQQAIQNNNIKVCIWGKGFPGGGTISGIHDVHMNQGNPVGGSFVSENAIWQDGAILFIEKDKPNALGALFLSFQSQCLKTDNNGNCIS